MGLDIHAASHLRYAAPIPDNDELDRMDEEADAAGKCLSEVCYLLYPNDEGWEDRLGGMEPGLYEYTPATEQHEFRVGSYGAYNDRRERLSQYALGVPPEAVWDKPTGYEGRPFGELIHFTDCDGAIGGSVAAKLAADFRDHAAGFARFARGDRDEEWLVSVYRNFAAAFASAAREGALRFC